MKSLDQTLFDAGRRWTGVHEDLLRAPDTALMQKLRPHGSGGLILSSIAAVSLAIASWFIWANTATSDQQVVTSSSKKTNVPARAVSTEFVRTPSTQHSTPATGEMVASKYDATARQDVQRVVDSNDMQEDFGSMNIKSSFDAEYKRLRDEAIRITNSDPLQAMQQYMGLSKLCERRGHQDKAMESAERAHMLAHRVGDKAMVQHITRQLERLRTLR